MTIDAHLHVWDPTAADYPWLGPGLAPFDRPLEFGEIAPVLRERGIDGVVLVQAADNAADTAVMRRVAADHPEVLGIVAWSPIDDPARLAEELPGFAADPLVVGVRNLIHEHPPEWLERPEVEEGLALLAAHGIPLDVPTADPTALGWVADAAERHPELTIVIDHLGKPPVGGSAAELARWRDLLAACAENTRTVAKLSGLYAPGPRLDAWAGEALRPVVEAALELFGPERLMYGGDWPIAELAGGYGRMWSALESLLTGLEPAARDEILEGTARRAYRLLAGLAPQDRPAA